jgi:hypothetical protein
MFASSASEWDRADAYQRGEENPHLAWVCTDRDVWHRNPFYKGPPVPHPEYPEEELAPEDDGWKVHLRDASTPESHEMDDFPF